MSKWFACLSVSLFVTVALAVWQLMNSACAYQVSTMIAAHTGTYLYWMQYPLSTEACWLGICMMHRRCCRAWVEDSKYSAAQSSRRSGCTHACIL